MRKWCRFPPKPCWNRIDTCVRSAIKGSSEIRICRCTGGATRCPGNCWSAKLRWPESVFSSARSRAASTTIPATPSAISSESKNISGENTATRSNGSAKNAPKATPFNPIIKPISKPAAPAATLATVAVFSPGSIHKSAQINIVFVLWNVRFTNQHKLIPLRFWNGITLLLPKS